MTSLIEGRKVNAPTGLPIAIVANILWNLAVALGSVILGLTILGMEGNFYELGRPVQMFAGAVALIPALAAAISIVLLLQKHYNGRYVALIIDFGTLALSVIALLHLWGVFIGFDAIARALYDNVIWLLGVPLAYFLYWIAGRLSDDTGIRRVLEQIALLIGMGSLILLLFFGGILNAVGYILSRYSDPLVILFTVVLILSAAMFVAMLRLGSYFHETPTQSEAWQGWLMLSPNIIGFLLFFAGPLLLSFYLSFTNDTVGRVPEIIGLRNYGEIISLQVKTQTDLTLNPQNALDGNYELLADFTIGSTRYVLGARDKLFWYSLRNTFLYCLLLLPLSVLPALLLSLILNSQLPGMKIYRAAYFLPSVAAVVGTALIWRWLYDPVIGFINYGVGGIVTWLNSSFGMSLADPKIEWLTNEGTVLLALVLMGAWQVIGFNTVLFLAGLQQVPKILYEAAYVDGAGTWKRFRFVTLPLLAPTTFFVLITTIITGLQVFNEPYALIFQRPMPLNATTAVYYLYNRGFFRFEFGYASAVAWLLFAVIFTVTLIQFRVQQRSGFDAYSGG
ncbi:MAG: sugar ABC transporter permease [Anaerolineae bacterium]|nr:sugar ABC transporter permease [Anaerolineae bacterium]